MIEQKVEDSSAKETELETLRDQIGKLKGVIIHSSLPNQAEPSRRPKRSSRRETWCPGEGMGGPLVLGGGVGGLNLLGVKTSTADDISDLDIKADIDMELSMFSYKQDHPPTSARKRQHTESPTPLSADGSFFSDQSTPKQSRAPSISLAKIPAFQRAEMLLSAKKEQAQDPSELIELRKELQRLKGTQAELQGKVIDMIIFHFASFFKREANTNIV